MAKGRRKKRTSSYPYIGKSSTLTKQVTLNVLKLFIWYNIKIEEVEAYKIRCSKMPLDYPEDNFGV